MKILGKHTKLKRREARVKVGHDETTGEPVWLTLAAPSLTVMEKIQGEVEDPPVPTLDRVQKDRRGNALKDEQGRPLLVENPNDPAYLTAKRRAGTARGVALLMICCGDQIVPGVNRADFKSGADYYLAVREELEEAGIDPGVLGLLLTEAARLVQPTTIEDEQNARDALGLTEGNGRGRSSGGSSASGS